MKDGLLLAIDAGNTRIKWGLWDGAAWLAHGAIPTPEAATLVATFAALPPPGRAIASNVAGDTVRRALEAACAATRASLDIIDSLPLQCGVSNGYSNPGQLGTDRWAALIAAHHATRGHKLVVNAGTALTIDALTATGQFLGGLIVPGPALMRRSLDRGTAALRLTEGRFDDLPRSTPDAITTGALQAAAGAVARMRETMASQGHVPDSVLLSGGAAAELAPHIPGVARREHLVLEGLARIASPG